jgi:hypothetical protein
MATASIKPHQVFHYGSNNSRSIISRPFSRMFPGLKADRNTGKASGHMCSAAAVETDLRKQEYRWSEVDEFTGLNDRLDSSPIPLPSIKEAKRVVLVRHGQSTWNAEGRIQGSSNVSVLTRKGESQAETTQQMVRSANHLACKPTLF